MKRLIKVIGILLVSTFILSPLKTNAQEPVWTQELDLNDSVSSAIAKVEDGVVVMQYEGAASSNNLLIKYDYNGNKIWEITNDYGYNIESVSDGFIVWSETKITKFDKDKNITWSKDVALQSTDAGDSTWHDIAAGLGGKLVELDDYYVIYQVHYINRLRNDIFILDKNGNITQRMSINNFLKKNNISSGDFWIYSIDNLSDNNFVLMYKTSGTWTPEPIHIAEITSDLTVIKDTKYQLDYSKVTQYSGVAVRNVIPTDKGYISFGSHIIYFLNNGEIKIHNKLALDVIKKDDYIYTYEIREKSIQYNDDNMDYETYIVQYDMNMEEKNSIRLPLALNKLIGPFSGLALLKNRFILENENSIVVLNTPMVYISSRDLQEELIDKYSESYKMQQGNYALSSYRFADDETPSTDDNNSTISGIINNIVKNPQTNSIIIIIVFIVLILAISTIMYITYRQKIKKQK